MGRWYIELIDTMKEEGDDRIVCLDIEEYAKKIEIMGLEYGDGVEVQWASDDNVTQIQINEVRQQMMVYEDKRQQEEDDAK